MSNRSSDLFASPSNHIRSPLTFLVVLALVLTAARMARADVTFNDGTSHTINNTVAGTVFVGPIVATTVNVVPNAVIDANTGAGSDGMNIAGGTVNISGGSVTGANIGTGQTGDFGAIYFNNIGNGGTLNISGGTVSAGTASGHSGLTETIIVDNAAAKINVSGGLVTGGSGALDDIDLNFGGTLTVTGGTIQDSPNGTDIFNRGTVDIYGGNIIAGTGEGIVDQGSGTTFIFGSSFNFAFGLIVPTNGTLIGTLSDGSPINISFSQPSGSIVLVHAVPEPASASLLTFASIILLARRMPERRVA